MRLRSLFIGMAPAVVIVACGSKQATVTPAAAEHKRAWCERVPLTTSSAGDRTRFDNTAERVIPIKSDIQAEALGCGAYYVGVSADAIMSAVVRGQPPPDGPGFIEKTDPSHCIMIYVRSDAPQPTANPLYLDGVRVYFVTDAVRAAVSAATDQQSNWCKDVPFTSDDRTDRTGTGNDEPRVKRIVSAAEQLVMQCPGVTGFAWQLNDTALEQMRGSPIGKGTSGTVSKSWVFRVYVRSRADLPKLNPLFLDGVRTYFTLETPDVPFDDSAARDASAAFDLAPVDAGVSDAAR